MCNSSHWSRPQLADTMSQSHRWEYGPVGQILVVSLELPAVVSAVADMAQLGDRSVVEEQLFVDMPEAAAAVACLVDMLAPSGVRQAGVRLEESS